MSDHVDIAVVGGGAAGLMAAVWAGRTAHSVRVIVLESARRIGAKILISGGGRCNVTHERVEASDFAGSTPPAIRKVLLRFDVARTIEFFKEIGIDLKREETGKLFPTTDRAHDVLDALVDAVRSAGAEIVHPRRVDAITRETDSFTVRGEWGSLRAVRVILATGGRSVPKTGSDGHGYEMVRALGHTTTPRIFPALVPLTLAPGHFIRGLSGLSADATLTVASPTGKPLARFTGSTLCTHFGLSGPCVLDISRRYIDALADEAGTRLVVNWLPGEDARGLETQLLEGGGGSVVGFLSARLPRRLAEALCRHVGVAPETPAHELRREERKNLVRAVTELELPVTGNRGFAVAEVTAGGVPLREIRLETMESRVCPGLHICGEICDVDGRIGGFNFQWAWASGYVTGVAAGAAVRGD